MIPPCRSPNGHRWTAVSSRKGYVNCARCPASKPGQSEFWGCGIVLVLGGVALGALAESIKAVIDTLS